MASFLQKYAQLLVHYCLEIQKGDRLYIKSTTAGEPLVREVYRYALRAGARVDVELTFREQGRILFEESSDFALGHVSPLHRHAIEKYEAYLRIMAPFNLAEDRGIDPEKYKLHQQGVKPVQKIYFDRIATRSLKRNLCQFPTVAAAQNAGISLEEYENFVFKACKLLEDDPGQQWLKVRAFQQNIVDFLNSRKEIRYQGDGIDIQFSTTGRNWINSDGQTNMPSGEVYTSPVENSVNGVIHFSYPAIYQGREVEGVTLWVKDGQVEKWEAKRGQDFLDQIFTVPGSRYFGEAAIGTNYDIQQFTGNILFDEKIGGTIHMAIGQSYIQAGGKNESSVHWDMIADMRNGGVIWADGEKIYDSGKFLFL